MEHYEWHCQPRTQLQLLNKQFTIRAEQLDRSKGEATVWRMREKMGET